MFHHFPDEAGVGANCLVRSTDFTYSDEVDPADARNPVYTVPAAPSPRPATGASDGGYIAAQPAAGRVRVQPAAIVQDAVRGGRPGSLREPAHRPGRRAYHWTDLHGEGIPGILTEQAGAWFYKRNLSPIAGRTAGGREVARAVRPARTVAAQAQRRLDAAAPQFMDLAGDGQPDVVVLGRPDARLLRARRGRGLGAVPPVHLAPESRLARPEPHASSTSTATATPTC